MANRWLRPVTDTHERFLTTRAATHQPTLVGQPVNDVDGWLPFLANTDE